MSYNLILLPEAQDDIIDCALWYTENHDPTGELANSFLDAVDETLQRLSETPTHHSIRHDNIRGIHIHRNAPKGRHVNFLISCFTGSKNLTSLSSRFSQ